MQVFCFTSTLLKDKYLVWYDFLLLLDMVALVTDQSHWNCPCLSSFHIPFQSCHPDPASSFFFGTRRQATFENRSIFPLHILQQLPEAGRWNDVITHHVKIHILGLLSCATSDSILVRTYSTYQEQRCWVFNRSSVRCPPDLLPPRRLWLPARPLTTHAAGCPWLPLRKL
jgi:hypothetical protein